MSGEEAEIAAAGGDSLSPTAQDKGAGGDSPTTQDKNATFGEATVTEVDA